MYCSLLIRILMLSLHQNISVAKSCLLLLLMVNILSSSYLSVVLNTVDYSIFLLFCSFIWLAKYHKLLIFLLTCGVLFSHFLLLLSLLPNILMLECPKRWSIFHFFICPQSLVDCFSGLTAQ